MVLQAYGRSEAQQPATRAVGAVRCQIYQCLLVKVDETTWYPNAVDQEVSIATALQVHQPWRQNLTVSVPRMVIGSSDCCSLPSRTPHGKPNSDLNGDCLLGLWSTGWSWTCQRFRHSPFPPVMISFLCWEKHGTASRHVDNWNKTTWISLIWESLRNDTFFPQVSYMSIAETCWNRSVSLWEMGLLALEALARLQINNQKLVQACGDLSSELRWRATRALVARGRWAMNPKVGNIYWIWQV